MLCVKKRLATRKLRPMRGSGNCVEVQVELRYGGPLSDLEPSGPRLDGRDNGTPQARNGKENNKLEFEGTINLVYQERIK